MKYKRNILFLILLTIVLFAGCEKASAVDESARTTKNPHQPIETLVVSTDGTDESDDNMSDDPLVSDDVKTECLNPSSDALLWITNFEKIHGEGTSEKVILDIAEIKEKNAAMESLAEYIVDIRNFNKSGEITEAQLKNWISAEMPYSPCYKENGTKFSDEELSVIYENQNVDGAGSFGIKRGIATCRADMRTVPCSEIVLKAPDNMPYDRIQETEIILGMPLWVLHESLDNKFYYVQSYYYRGWVRKSDVAVTDNEELWNYFTKNENFVVVTDPIVRLCDKNIDMGATLPIESEEQNVFKVTLPDRTATGELTKKTAEIDKTKAYKGFVPYTMANYYTQAFKYIGTIYGWGGMNNGVDCSSFVCAVMRTFGFEMPRNTSQQCKIMCDPVDLKAISSIERENIFKELDSPAALFNPGHVRLVLGEKDGKYYVIHAPSAGKPVCVAEFTPLDENLTYLSIIE